MRLQKPAGWSALIIAASYIFGFGLFMAVLDRTGYDGLTGDVAFVADHQNMLAVAMIALYVIAGCALVVLSLGLHERLAPSDSAWNPVATSFGLIWAGLVIASGFVGLIGIQTMAAMASTKPELAASAWIAIGVVQDGLGGGIELVGGVWLMLISWIAHRGDALPKLLNSLGAVIGCAGIATVAPGLGELAAIFGLSQIVWFCWLAIIMLRPAKSASAYSAAGSDPA